MRSLLIAAYAGACTVMLTGCQVGGVDASPPVPGEQALDDPAAAGSCLLRAPLELGRCDSAATGAPCTGLPGEATRFVPLAEGETVAWRRGPDGPELALAVRGVGMAVGETALADVVLSRTTGALVVRQQGPLHFRGDAFMAESTALVVLMDGARVAGDVLRTTVLLEDRNHERRCGRRHLVLQAAP